MLAVAKPEFDAGGMEPRVSLELQVEVLHVGYASAMGWVMFVFILLLTLGALKYSDKHVHYETS